MPLFEALKSHAHEPWQAYTRHAFVRQLARGTLPEACFRHYLKQDYLFLKHFARAWALAVVKSQSLEDMRACTATVNGLIVEEMALHVGYCAEWGIGEDELQSVPEAPANMLYTRYVLDIGQSGDLLDLLTALAPCFLGYAEIGAWIAANPDTRLDGNPYRAWIEMYAGEDFQEAATRSRQQLDRLAGQRGLAGNPKSSPRWPSLARIFTTAVELEIGFWDMGLAAPAD
ncbi:MAG: thiaminase II [Rhodovibrionaceae bacterium]